MAIDTTNIIKEELEKKIDYLKMEYQFNYSELMGVLEMIKLDYYMECLESE